MFFQAILSAEAVLSGWDESPICFAIDWKKEEIKALACDLVPNLGDAQGIKQSPSF